MKTVIKGMNGFIVDEMLLKLGRFLRIAGYEVLIPRNETDQTIATLTMERKMVLLTRDKDLSNRRGVPAIRLEGENVNDQLKELMAVEGITSIPRAGSYCPVCGGALDRIQRPIGGWESLLQGFSIPSSREYEEIFRCISCNKVYWRGSHWEGLIRVLSPFGLVPDI